MLATRPPDRRTAGPPDRWPEWSEMAQPTRRAPEVSLSAEPTTVQSSTLNSSTVYSSTESCAVTLSPSTFGPTDEVTFSASFSSIGATYGLADGTHTMDFYAVDATGAAVGERLCSSTYTYNGPVAQSMVVGPTELPRATVGVNDVAPTGTYIYTPGVVGATVLSCDIELVSYTPTPNQREADGSFGGGIQDGQWYELIPETADVQFPLKGADGAELAASNNIKQLGLGLSFTPGDLSPECGTLWCTPIQAGAYTFRQKTYFRYPSDSVAPRSISVADVDSQTYASSRILNLEVDLALPPAFTG